MRSCAFEVLVVGGGPGGLAAATTAAGAGARVGLVDDNPGLGGQVWRAGGGDARARRLRRRIAETGVRVLGGARVVAPADVDALLVETPDGPLAARWQRLILAPGARELFLPFPGWTLPGVTGAGGLQALAKGGWPVAGKAVVVAGSGPLLLSVAALLLRHGARVRLIAEQAPWARLAPFAWRLPADRPRLAQAAGLAWRVRGVPYRPGTWVGRAEGGGHVEAVLLQREDGRAWTERCDLLACGFGLVPNVELPLALGCALREGAVRVDPWQRTSVPGVYCAGEAAGGGGLEAALVTGEIAGLAATSQMDAARARFGDREQSRRFAAALARCFSLRDELRHLAAPETILCRCEDVPLGAVAGRAGWRHAKLRTRCGMGPCQGRVCGAAAAFLFGWGPEPPRPPVVPATVGTLAAADGASPPTGDEGGWAAAGAREGPRA